jgi:hypothetical protein
LITNDPTTKKNRSRGREIIQLLFDHGPLSFGALSRMINPKMRPKKLKETLLRLRRKGFLATRYFGEIKVFYFVSQQHANRIQLSKLLKCRPTQLIQPVSSRRDWIHSEACEYWIFILKRLFSDAKFVREREFVDHELARRLLLITKDEFELRPDFLMIFERGADSEPVSVAVEVERTRKSNRRLIEKLRKYAKRSLVDGLIYACDSDRLAETIRLLYQNKVQERALRIGHYGNNFFLLSDAINPHDDHVKNIFNVKKERVSLPEWINYFKSKGRNFRRDHEFPLQGESAPAPLSNY